MLAHDDNDVVANVPDYTQSSKPTFSMNSFFAGIGGFDIAFDRHGFNTLYQCEINDFCNEILQMHWPHVSKGTDIQNVSPSSIPQAEVWCGGFPCQDVSVARGSAERKGLSGSQSGLFFAYANLIESRKPKVVVIENVGGLFNSNDGRDFGVILQRMSEMGYSVAWRLLNSRYFGVPQSRPRVYLCCWHNDAWRAMASLFEKDGAAKPGTGVRKDFITEAPGSSGYPIVPKVSYCLAATSGRHTGTDWSRTYIVCNDGVRRMTPLEYERLQGFPDGWTRPKDNEGMSGEDVDTLRYHAIGNAVSVPVVEWIASRIFDNLADESKKAFTSSTPNNYIPEFKTSQWSDTPLSVIDFTDGSKKYKWPHDGIMFNDHFIGGKIQPTPHIIIDSSLINLVERHPVSRRYYLTPNAAEGILRRVDNQGRSLFSPLRIALEKEMEKKKGNKC